MTTEEITRRYRDFADRQAAGTSPAFERWARGLAADQTVLELLDDLSHTEQQPNLVLAAARLHGAVPGDVGSLHDVLTGRWEQVRETLATRRTQTNEAARGAALLLGLEQVDGPVALLELGASAGLCLVPDRYSYRFSDGSRLDPRDGPSRLVVDIEVRDGLRPPTRMPDIVWRTGIDLNPLDPGDADDLAWLRMLVWPEHDERRARLDAAAAIAAQSHLVVERGDLLHDLPAVAARAPREATLVVVHSATLAYLDAEQRRRAIDLVDGVGARRLGFEGRGVDPVVPELGGRTSPDTLFVAALDGVPYALADGHGSRLSALPGSGRAR